MAYLVNNYTRFWGFAKGSGVAAAVALVVSGGVLALDVTDVIDVEIDHPQTIAITAPADIDDAAGGTVLNRAWTITSNNAVGVNFTGTSAGTADGSTATAQAFPQFYRQEVDATGAAMTGKYDHLATVFGAVVSGFRDIAGSTATDNVAWGGGTAPTGTPASLVLARDAEGSPDAAWGSIMPADDGTVTLTLYAKGTGDTSTTQSGDYWGAGFAAWRRVF